MRSRLVQARILAQLRHQRRRLDRADENTRDERRDASLRRLRGHAGARSPWYAEHHRGLDRAPLAELPVLRKADIVDRFDEVVADPRLRIADVRRVVEHGGRLPHGFRIGASSGSSGRPGLLVFDTNEWTALLVNAARARSLAAPLTPGAGGRVRTARIGSPSPWHLSRQVPATLEDPRKPALVLSAATAVASIAEQLARWRPDIVSGYPSVVAALAGMQIDGELDIAPRQVFTGGEPLTAGTRALVHEAWRVEPFDQYVTAEVGFVAMECEAHDGLHVMDDHVIVEVVDDDGAAVPAGEQGTRVLVTALSSRTLPLIRYELGDAAALAEGPCPCGRRAPRLRSIAGQARSLLHMAGPDGGDVAIHPVVFTSILDPAAVRAWRVTVGRDRVVVRVVRPASSFDPDRVGEQVRSALGAAGVGRVEVTVQTVAELPRAETGKATLVEAADPPAGP